MKEHGKNILSWMVTVVGVMLASAFPAWFLYCNNAGEAHLSDVLPIMLLFMLFGVLVLTLFYLLTRSREKAGITTIVVLIALLNYHSVESVVTTVFPTLYYWHILPVVLFLLFLSSLLIHRKLVQELAEIIMPVLCAVLLALTVINGFIAAPSAGRRADAEREAKRQAEAQTEAEEYMPNFYFILFDEFSTVPFMEKYFSYDNSALLDKLRELGFNISQTGHNADNRTANITADLFQLDEVAGGKELSSEELFALRSDNRVFPLLREAGYTIVSPAGASFYGLPDALEQSAEAGTVGGKNAKTLIWERTAFYPFLSKSGNLSAQKILDQLAWLEDSGNYARSNQFTLAHLELPHTPFQFDADGNVMQNVSNSWEDLSFYLHQYQFATKEMEKIARKIVKSDPNAVIWVLSDHSARASSSPEQYLKLFPMEDMTNFFSAVYYHGETLDIEGLSGVDTFRLLLSHLLETDAFMAKQLADGVR